MIEARGLTRRFGAVAAVSELSLAVQGGSILALLGPNGAGKTTTIRMLAALLAPSSGEATVAGYDVRREPAAVRAAVGLVTDVPGLYEQMAVGDYLNLFATIYGLPAGQRRRRIAELIDFFELGPFRSQRMVSYSKGMKQKVALARALLHEPPVLFLDEPTSGLDPLAGRAVRELILGLRHSRRSIILCTHDLDEAERMADEVAIMRAGLIVARNTPAALRGQAAAGRMVRVVLAGPCPQALSALQDTAGVEQPQLVPAAGQAVADEGPGQPPTAALTYLAREPESVNPAAVARLVAAGARVVSVTIETPSLEDAYAAAMTGRGDRTRPAPRSAGEG